MVSQQRPPAPAIVHAHVILGGRVMDPGSRLDAVRNVGIDGSRITALTAGALRGRDTIDARGLVATPRADSRTMAVNPPGGCVSHLFPELPCT